jgi:translation elongation factor EF-Tu-like GTPase
MASRSDLKLLDFALGNGFDANEWLHHEDRTRCVSILAAVVSSAVDAESTKARKHLVKIARVLMKHGADPDKLPHACAVEAPEDKRSLNQWAREEHGAANLNEYLDKLEKRPVAARRASLSIGLEELFGIAAQGVKVTELPGIRIVIVGRRR